MTLVTLCPARLHPVWGNDLGPLAGWFPPFL